MTKRSTLALLCVLALVPGCASVGKLVGLGEKLDDQIDWETFGEDFDDLCIPGQVREAREWLNANQLTWKQHKDYTDRRQPNPLKSHDRFFNGDCSEVTKRLFDGDFDGAAEALGDVVEVEREVESE